MTGASSEFLDPAAIARVRRHWVSWYRSMNGGPPPRDDTEGDTEYGGDQCSEDRERDQPSPAELDDAPHDHQLIVDYRGHNAATIQTQRSDDPSWSACARRISGVRKIDWSGPFGQSGGRVTPRSLLRPPAGRALPGLRGTSVPESPNRPPGVAHQLARNCRASPGTGHVAGRLSVTNLFTRSRRRLRRRTRPLAAAVLASLRAASATVAQHKRLLEPGARTRKGHALSPCSSRGKKITKLDALMSADGSS